MTAARTETSPEHTEEIVADALAQADDLASQGRRLAAVESLVEVARQHRDVRLEEALVRMRLDAFAELDRTPGRDQWPPTLSDPFPDVSGAPPEVPASDLDPATLGGALLHHGSLVVRNLLDSDRSQQLLASVQRAFEALDTRADPDAMSDVERARWFQRCSHDGSKPSLFGMGTATMRVIDSPALVFDVVEAFHSSPLIGAIAGYLGEQPALSNNKWAIRRSKGLPFSDLHQDGAFLGDDIRTVNAWISLTHAGGDSSAPSIEMVPSRLPGVLPTGGHGAAFDWTVSDEGLATMVPGVELVTPEVFPGDAVLFDELMMHRTQCRDADSSDWRWAVESWFFAPSCYPQRYAGIAV
ncbi:MAG: phytanoyl-CoA dioxygenase family protein [Acidimicrobiia bacterium]|nr:phytanoyl-CoA dioxygenase family protein [Acidimicrobiia bacterium]